MKKIFLVLLFFMCLEMLFSQEKAEIGVYAGIAYYNGDINPDQVFYSNKANVGVLYRYNLDSRYALRASMLFSDLSADDKDFNNSFQQKRGASFSTEIIDFSVQLEFNFQSFWIPKKSYTKRVSPFIALGLGYISSVGTSSSVCIPFSTGAKIAIGERWCATLECNFRKTFTDNLDDLSDPHKFNKKSFFHNNDWISSVGIAITYKLFPDLGDCRFYDSYIK